MHPIISREPRDILVIKISQLHPLDYREVSIQEEMLRRL